MLRIDLRSPLIGLLRALVSTCCIMVLCLAPGISGDGVAKEPRYPEVMLNWMVEGTFHGQPAYEGMITRGSRSVMIWVDAGGNILDRHLTS